MNASADLLFALGSQVANKVSATANQIGETVGLATHQTLETTADTVGKEIAPIADHPGMNLATKVPGLGWLSSALGKVDLDKVHTDIEKLKQKHPAATPTELAQKVIEESSRKAGTVGLVTNIVPPVALMLLAVDLAAVSSLQAEMLYRIAAIYGFDTTDPARKGEALGIFAASLGATSVVKAGLSAVELIPLVGAAVGATSNAGILYSFGQAADQFYRRKLETKSAKKVA